MTTLPLVPPLVPSAGELPIKTSDDVKALLPKDFTQLDEEDPVLEAMVEAITEIAIAWEDAGTGAAAQSNVAEATDQYLDGQGNDRQVYRAGNEQNEPYRDRMLAVPRATDMDSILAAVNAILAPYTTAQATLFDSILDRWFITDGVTENFHSFIGESPQYEDRLYPDDAAANGGLFIPQSDPGGAYAFSDMVGRFFVLRVPDISAINDEHTFIFDSSEVAPDSVVIDPTIRAFVGDSSQSDPASFVAQDIKTALDVYQSVADSVNAIVGHGFRWSLVVDPNLV